MYLVYEKLWKYEPTELNQVSHFLSFDNLDHMVASVGATMTSEVCWIITAFCFLEKTAQQIDYICISNIFISSIRNEFPWAVSILQSCC